MAKIIKYGEDSLDKYLRKKHISKKELLSDDNLKKILKELKCKDVNELFLNLGNNKFVPKTIVDIIYPHEVIRVQEHEEKIRNNTDIKVSGIDNIKVNISSCCRPIPGDSIIGYVTKGEGINIHRKDCINVQDTNRTIDVHWNEQLNKRYPADIYIKAIFNEKLLVDIVSKTSLCNVIIQSMNSKRYDNYIIYNLTVMVNNLDQLKKFMTALEQLSDISLVDRRNT